MSSCVVTPLTPPFSEDVMNFQFFGEEKVLAVSKRDGRKIIDLLGGNDPAGRAVILEPIEGDDEKIRVSVLQ
jgi:hypothetical protein